jgi:hypothetical protein
MLEVLGAGLVAYIEREIIKHEPEIQAMVIDQLDKLATLLCDYVQSKLSDKVNASADEEPKQQLSQD